MRIDQSAALPPSLAQQAAEIGDALLRLRQARRIKQSEAALRAGISRATAQRLERGDPGVSLGIALRYLDAIAPGATLLKLLSGKDPSLAAMEQGLRPRRVRGLTAAELEALDF
jgi:transcriptional regulator with XRE-family HTH domain